MVTPTTGPTAAEVEAARVLLAKLGISAEALLSAAQPAQPQVPTFAVYVPRVSAVVSDGTRRAYGPYWRRIVEAWGDRRLDEPTATDVRQLATQARENAVVRRNARGGRSAAEHTLSALRCLYRHAESDRYVTAADNPAAKVAKPRRIPSPRRAIPANRLAEINQVVATTGNDPALDTLILRLHTETACRRGGALSLRPMDLDPSQCLILLREKGETERLQPVSPTLMAALQQHAAERGAPTTEPLLRYRNGKPITKRRYDHVWNRVGKHLPWAASQGVSVHWIRYTTLTWVERNFGYAIARAYAGHSDGTHSIGTTATYVRADIEEVAAALAALTGEPHPLTT